MAIHRFKFSTELNDKIQIFANLHMYDENFKESFNTWCETEEMSQLIENENEYLSRHNYTVDTKHKIYRSIKYYYVKKFTSHDIPEQKIRNTPVKVSKDIMDTIKTHLKEEFEKNPKFKPSETFDVFKELIKNDDPLIKKCYKNQYYQIKNKMYNVNA
jgi:hypothetical protein